MATPAAVLSIVVEAQTGKAAAELQKFNRGLSDKSIKITAEIDQSSFTRVRRAAGALGGSESVKLKADVDVASFARARAVQAVLTKESSKLTDVFSRSHLSIGQWTAILAAAAPVAVDLVGALGALTASLGAATVGFGALAAGAASAATVGFGGILAIAAPAISSLTDLMTAQKAADKARVTGSASAARASVASAQQILAAEQQLTSAQRSAEFAQESLNLAREEATRQLQDMRRAALGANESEESARIALRRSEIELRRVRGDLSSGALDVREAENEVALARNNLRDVTISGNRAQEDYNKAHKEGIDQMPTVVSAQRSLDEANRSVADAVQNLAYQQKQANEATAAGGTSLAALALAQKKAGPEAVKFAKSIKSLGREWRGLTREGKADFFGMLNDGLDRLNTKLPLLAESANKSMDALRGGFNQFLNRATGPEFNHFIDVMTNTFAKSIGPISRGFGNIAKVLQRIAVAVAPDVIRMMRGFEGITEGWVDSTRNAGKLREVIHRLVGQTKAWWDLLVAAKDLIVAVLVPGMGEGKKAVKGMTDQLKEWTNWANAHPEEIRNFMKEGLETARRLAEALLSFLPTLFQISKAARPVARLFLVAVKALNTFKIGDWSLLSVVIGAIVAKKVINGVLAVRTAFIGLRTALFGAAAAETAMGAATARTTAAMTAQQVMAKSSMFGAGLAAPAAASPVASGLQAAGGVAGGVLLGAGVLDVSDDVRKANSAFDKLRETVQGVIGGPAGLGLRGLSKLTGSELPNKLAALITPIGQAKLAFKGFQAAAGLAGRVSSRVLTRSWDVIKDVFRGGAKAALGIVRAMPGPLGDVLQKMGKTMRSVFSRTWDAVTDIFKAGRDSVKAVMHGMGRGITGVMQGIRGAFSGVAKVIKTVIRFIVKAVNKAVDALGELKSKIPDITPDVNVPDITPWSGAAPWKTGGVIVPGKGSGDKVPAMLEPGEVVWNREAVKSLFGNAQKADKANKMVPRFATGGVVDRTGVQHFARGGMAAMIAEANKFEQRGFPYAWGGGHGGFGIQPVDCSGAVSDILHAAGLLTAPMTSGALMNWGKPGKGPLTVYTNPHHVVMSLNGKVFGTSGSNPGGGAGWIEGASGEQLAPGAVRTMDVAGGVLSQIKRIMVEGKGPLKDMAQGAADKMRRVANKYIQEKTGGMFGGGQKLSEGALSKGQIASVWRQANQGQGNPGLMAAIALAESAGDPRAVGHDAGGTTGLGLWQITTGYNDDLIARYGGKRGMFNPFNNAQAAGDLLARQGLGAWVVYNEGTYRNFLKRGGMVPYVGSFDKGGTVAQTGMGMLHKGEEVLSAQRGGVVPGLERAVKHLQRVIQPHPLHDARIQRNRERRERREDERQRLARLQRETRQETRERHRREHRQERRQHRREERRQEIEMARQQIQVDKELIRVITEQNRRYGALKAAEGIVVPALTNLVGKEIGAKGLEKRRLAAGGSVARY